MEQQRSLVVQLLRARFANLTFDDLRALLASPLGKGLGPVRVAELVADPSSASAAGKPPRSSATKPKKKPAKAKKTAAKSASKKRKSSTKRATPELQAAVLAALQAEKGPISGPALAEKVKVHRTTIRLALRELVQAGRVAASGPPTRLTYSIKASEAPASPANPPAQRKRTKQKTPTTSPPSDSLQGGQAGYDGAVLAVIRAAKTGVASSTIQSLVGGSIDHVRAALHRLIEAGQIVRTGERKFTKYELRGTP